MRYNIHYDIAALVVLIAIFSNLSKTKYFPSRQNRTFKGIVYLSFVGTLFDLTSCFSIQYSARIPVWINMIILLVYYICQATMPMMMALYMISLTGKHSQKHQGKIRLAMISFYITVLLILTTPFTGWVFAYDTANNNYYQTGPLMPVIFVNYGLYFIVSLVLLLRNRKDLSPKVHFSTGAFFCVTLVAVLIQFMDAHYQLSGFASAISILILYIFNQHPSEYQDNITGTFNRTSFLAYIKQLMLNDTDTSVIIYKITDLQDINLLYGPETVDQLVKDMSNKLSTDFPDNLQFRLSRDLFALIPAPDADYRETLDALFTMFRQPWEVLNNFLLLNINVSAAESISFADTAGKLLEMMERALPLKDERKIVEFDNRLVAEMQYEIAVEQALQEAIENESIEVYLQPIYSLKEKCFIGAEALSRLHDEKLGDIRPDLFIKLAEKNGSITQIDEMVLRKVCKMIAENHLTKVPNFKFISVNLSVTELRIEELPTMLSHVTRQADVDPKYIRFEVTETAASITRTSLASSIERLRAKGFIFELDDFGSGYANLGSVVELPFETIKIDRSLLADSLTSPEKAVLYEYIITMLKALNYEVLAEGIETEEQARIVTRHGVSMAQGYYYAKPMPMSDFIQMFSRYRL